MSRNPKRKSCKSKSDKNSTTGQNLDGKNIVVALFEKEDAYKSLDLVNGWISSMDTKASFLLAYLAVLLGFVVSNGIPRVLSAPNEFETLFSYVVGIGLVVLLYVLILISVALFFGTIRARVNVGGQHSLLFFGEISKMGLDDYRHRILKRTKEELINDVLEQTHTNARICHRKCKLFNIGVVTTFIGTAIYIICILLNVL